MKIVYTKHAEEKLKRKDIKKFGIKKKLIEQAIENPNYTDKTMYGDFAVLLALDSYTLRVIYGKVAKKLKVITFHLAKRGRYEAKILQRGWHISSYFLK